MKDDPSLSYREAYEVFQQGKTNADLIARGLNIKGDDSLTNRIKVYNEGLDKIKILSIVANSPKATPEQKKAYADAVAKLGPNPALESSGQQVAPAATIQPLPGAKIVGSRPA
jgi:hypothetical protein